MTNQPGFPIKFTKRAAFGLGSYRVLFDGEDIGEVTKWERRYNLRRVIVSRGWRAITPDGRRLYTPDGTTSDTRAGAADALVRARKERRVPMIEAELRRPS